MKGRPVLVCRPVRLMLLAPAVPSRALLLPCQISIEDEAALKPESDVAPAPTIFKRSTPLPPLSASLSASAPVICKHVIAKAAIDGSQSPAPPRRSSAKLEPISVSLPAPASTKGKTGDGAERGEIERICGGGSEHTLIVALPDLDRRGRGVETAQRRSRATGDEDAVVPGPAGETVANAFRPGDRKDVVAVAAIHAVGADRRR